jgi:hypothetical protein
LLGAYAREIIPPEVIMNVDERRINDGSSAEIHAIRTNFCKGCDRISFDINATGLLYSVRRRYDTAC